jgi:hypothetical protein
MPTLPYLQDLFSLLFSNFVEEKRNKEKRKKVTFLPASDKGSYTSYFLEIFPCIYV